MGGTYYYTITLTETNALNEAPVAVIISSTQQAKSGEYIIFEASNSYDPEGGELQYYWDFGDGGTAETSFVSHRFRGAQNKAKTYMVSLTVENNLGLTNTTQVKIKILPLTKSIEILCTIPFQEGVNNRMTVHYNWVHDNTYIVTKISYEAIRFIGVASISIWDFHSKVVPLPIWVRDILGKEAVYYPSNHIYQHGTEMFEGILVDTYDAMNIYTIGWYSMLSWGISFPAPSFKTVSTCFMPDYDEEPEVPVEAPTSFFASKFSPGELRIYDSEGRLTGLKDGEIINQIPNSTYINDTVIILPSNNTAFYSEIKGTVAGNYSLVLNYVINENINTFIASNIPIDSSEFHYFTINWTLLAEGKEGARIQIDIDGDGEIDYEFYSDKELTLEEFLEAIQGGEGRRGIPGYNLFIVLGILSFVVVLMRKIFKEGLCLHAKN